MVKTYNVSLDQKVVEEARQELQVGQALSPVLNDLLKKWIAQKKKEKQK